MAPLADPAVEGFRVPFLPQDGELLDCLLRPKIACGRVDSRFAPLVHDVADVFALPPGQLAAMHEGVPGAGGDKVWYFFSTRVVAGSASGGGGRRARPVGGDGSKRWCKVGAKKVVEGGGYCHRFRYKEKTASGDVAPGWMMLEYGVAQEHGGEGYAELVLCKIFRSPVSSRSESASPSSSSGGRKRKAAE